MQKLLPKVRLADGSLTPGVRSEMTLRRRHAKVALTLDLTGKTVIDIGCDAGLYSLYMARNAKRVVGIDRNPDAIRVARATARALGIANVEFIEGTFQDNLKSIGQCDLAVMWGFLHRVPDIFTLLGDVSRIASAFSLEWQCPVFPSMEDFPMAYYPTTPPGVSGGNLFSLRLMDEEGRVSGNDGRVLNDHFFEPTPALVAEVCSDLGMPHSTILGYSDEFRSTSEVIAKQFDASGNLLSPYPAKRLRPKNMGVSRVHMVVERVKGSIGGLSNLRQFSAEMLPPWDIGMREYFKHPVRRSKPGRRVPA